MDTENDLLTARKIARYFGIPMSWVITEADAGRLPHLRAGRQRLFNIEAVRQALIHAASKVPKDADP